jgi:hypothetical protein
MRMALMMAKLYAALRAANVPDATASEAAAEAAEYENRFSKVESDLGVLKWMVGTNLALTVLVLGKLFLR